MRLDKPRLLDPDSAITREIAEDFPAVLNRACCASQWQRFVCTRAQGHDGPCVSHNADGNPVAVWPQEGK